jgi:serine phosphatase RsbU (regulator of sigma subunit)
MGKSVSIRRSLLTNLVIIVLLMSGAIMLTMVVGARMAVRSLSSQVISQAVGQTEGKLQGLFDPIVDQLLLMQSWGEKGLLDLQEPNSLTSLFTPLLENNQRISSIILADNRGGEYMLLRTGEKWTNRRIFFDGAQRRASVRDWTEQSPQVTESFSAIDYDPRTRPWYKGARAKHSKAGRSSVPAKGVALVHWTQPYTFFTAKKLGITVSALFIAPDGIERIIAFDVLLKDIQTITSQVSVFQHGNILILTDQLGIIAYPEAMLSQTGLGRPDVLLKRPRELNWALARDATEAFGKSHTPQDFLEPIRFISDSRAWWTVAKPFDLSADRQLWVCVMVPESDLLGSLQQRRLWIIVISLVVLIVGIIRAFVLAGRYSRPIETLVKETIRISRGDLEPGHPVESNVTEVCQLARAQDQMRIGLAALMKMERDMQLAQQIQQQTFPPHLPRLSGFDIDAWNQPADETGGDTYDVIGYNTAADNKTIILSAEQSDRAMLLLADATGHGIGPALSVTQLRAMLRMAVRISPEMFRIVSHMNAQLCDDLPSGRFITAWLGELNTAGHTLTYFSAGQGPLIRYDAAGDSFDIIAADVCPFGISEAIDTTVSPPVDMKPGDIFAVISDGIFEAADAQKDQFGVQRACEVIRTNKNSPAKDILVAIRETVNEFTHDAPPDDDRTIIIIKRV